MAAAFNKTISDPLWAPHLAYRGLTTTGGKSTPMTGTLDSSMGQWHAVATVGKTKTETISDGATGYTMQYGVWFKAPVRSTTLATLIAGATGFTDSGVEAEDGQQLHHMVLPAGTVVNATALGVPAGGDAQVTLDGWADETGTPIAFTIGAQWTAASGKAKVARTLALAVAVATPAGAITTPSEDQLWVWKTSSAKRYLVAYPSTWEYRKTGPKKFDYFDGFDGTFTGVARVSSYGLSLNTIATYARTHAAKWSGLSGASVVANTSARLSGVPARLLIIKGKYKGTVKYHYDVFAVRGGYLYELFVSFPRKPTAADLVIWKAFLATYKIK